MKYFVKGWYEDNNKAEKIMKEYNKYYKSIERQLPQSIKNVLKNRHDTHIISTAFIKSNYIMELEECVWGKANIIFCNAIVKHSENIKDEYWLYDEVYKVSDKIELHILFERSEIIIECDDAYISIEDKNYIEELYKKKDFKIYMDNPIVEAVIEKEYICGRDMLKNCELLIFSYYQIWSHINYYKNRNIEYLIENTYYRYSEKEKEEIYIKFFAELEENIKESIQTLKKYKEIIKDEDLNYITNRLLELYEKKHIPIKEKNQLYLELNEKLHVDFNKIYKRILDCINEGLIK